MGIILGRIFWKKIMVSSSGNDSNCDRCLLIFSIPFARTRGNQLDVRRWKRLYAFEKGKNGFGAFLRTFLDDDFCMV